MKHNQDVSVLAHDWHTPLQKGPKNSAKTGVLTHQMTHEMTHGFGRENLPKLVAFPVAAKVFFSVVYSRFSSLFIARFGLTFFYLTKLAVYRQRVHSLPFLFTIKSLPL